MNNSVKYENGKLTIPISVMKKYVQDIVNMINILRGNIEIEDIELISLDGVKYDKIKDSIPFRILDGEFVPYVETFMASYEVKACAEDGSSCEVVTKHAYMMKTMIGTFVIDEDVNLATIQPGTANIIPKYTIPVIGGAMARPIAQATKSFPQNFHDSLKAKKDTEMLIEKSMYYGVISITSSKVNWIPLAFDTSNIEQGSLEVSSKLLQEYRSIHEKSYPIKGIYQVTESERDCLNAIAQKSLSGSDGNIKSSIRINFDSETAKEIIEHVAKPSKLNYKVGSLKVGASVDVIFPPIFANLLSRRLEFDSSKFSKGDSVEVTLTQDDLPNIAAFIEGTVRDIVNNSTSAVKEALMAPCIMYLNLVGDLENAVDQ